MKNKSAQDLVKIRWDKTTKQQRQLHASKMGKASAAKRKVLHIAKKAI